MGLIKGKNQLCVALALACSILLRYCQAQEAEACSEVLCWTLLCVWSAFMGLDSIDHELVGICPWIVAAGIALASVFRSLLDVQWILSTLSPCLSLVRILFPPLSTPAREPLTSFHFNSLPGQVLVSAVSLITLLPASDPSVPSLGIALLYLLTFIGVLTVLNRMTCRKCPSRSILDGSSSVAMTRVLAIRTLPFVCVATIVLLQFQSFQVTTATGPTILVSGVLKTIRWVSLWSMTEEIPWDVVAPISTAAIAIASNVATAPGAASWLIAGYLVTALVNLAQTIAYLPSTSKSKLLIFGFAVIPIAGLLPDVGMWKDSVAVKYGRPHPVPAKHPVEQLIIKSRADFSAMVKRQSNTLEEAVAEYQRRYDMDPPPGFDQWFDFAKNRASTVLTDEFDAIHESISPFWKFPAATLRKNMKQASKLDRDLLSCRYEKGVFKGKCGWQGNDIELIMSTVAHLLPDFQFLLSTADGPRVLMSQDIEEASQDVAFQSYDGQDIWDVVSASCAHPADRVPHRHANPTIPTHGLPFIQDVRESKNTCQHPEYANQHAQFLSPVGAKFTRQAVPVFSQAKASMFSDILVPSVYYYSTASGGRYDPTIDPIWSKKSDKRLYWAGSNTGGLNHKGLWKDFQRQRFVSRTSHLNDQSETYLAETQPGVWSSYQSSEHLSLFDVKFTAYIQCRPQRECAKHAAIYGHHEREFRPKMYKHRLNADIDGNGYSGRWYSILRSHSTPFKQTIYREWHDDRLYPWVHYVPMSVSFDEVPELTRYFSQTQAGEKYAKEIANESHDWFGRALRWEDFQVYFYRLALEQARLLDDNREVRT